MTRRIPVLYALAALASLAALPAPARAGGAWTTYMRLTNCTDMVALPDTVWIASKEAGLVRYLRSVDRFESITREPGGLASNDVTSLAFDRSGRLWAGTPGKGASRLSADLATWDLVNAFDGLPSDSVNVVRTTGDSVWIGTQGGLALWDGVQVAGAVPDLGAPSPFRSNQVRGVAVVNDSLFVGTGDGVYVALLSANLTTWTALDSGLTSRNVFAMATDGHEVFVLVNTTPYRWNRGTGRWGVASGAGTVRQLRDDFGRITCSSETGLWRWTGGGWTLLPGSPVATSAWPGQVEFAPDPAGTCFAMRDGRLRIEGAPWTSLELPGPADNDLQNVAIDGDRVWIATFSQGVARFDGTQWRNFPAGCCGAQQDTSFANPAYAFALLRDHAGYKWLATWGTAVERLDDSVDPPHVVRPILPYAGGPDSLVNHTNLWSAVSDDSDYVYIGGDTPDRGGRPPVGIDVFAPDGTLRSVWTTTNSGIPDNQVRALAVSRGRLWAGFPGTGIAWATLPAGRSAPPCSGSWRGATRCGSSRRRASSDSAPRPSRRSPRSTSPARPRREARCTRSRSPRTARPGSARWRACAATAPAAATRTTRPPTRRSRTTRSARSRPIPRRASSGSRPPAGCPDSTPATRRPHPPRSPRSTCSSTRTRRSSPPWGST
jgi:hypothetical protein